MEKLGLRDARQILTMLNGEEIASFKLSSRISSLLQQEGLLLSRSNGSRCKYWIDSSRRMSCRIFLSQQFGLKCSLEEWITKDYNLTRAEQVNLVGNSKFKAVGTFHGFLVDCYSPILSTMGGQSFVLQPMEGSSVFISQPEVFEVPTDVTIVGVENAENFMQIRRQKHLFESLMLDKQLFVCRYPQNALADLRKWLRRIPNKYIHFGDFDLAGVHIYLSEFYSQLGDRASFLVPDDIEERLATGNASLYDQQYLKYKDMKVADFRVLPLVDMINHYRRGYEQEGYIE